MTIKPGQTFHHEPVLLQEVIAGLAVKEDGIYLDGTVGGGGHSRAIAEKLSAKGTLIGIDRDPEALQVAGERLQGLPCRKIFVHANFRDAREILRANNIAALHGALLDIGVSSYQLDNAARGFSYMQDAPLDMRMDPQASLSAETVVNTYSKDELTAILRRYGEEKWASRIASFLVRAREKKTLTTTGELVEAVKAAIPAAARRGGHHPAKRTFQAIRIEVNGELDALSASVKDLIDCLKPGGRLAIITFHSLEDRIVKEIFAKEENPCTCPPEIPVCVCGKKPRIRRITKKPVTASAAEVEMNPRARSAKLRICEKPEENEG